MSACSWSCLDARPPGLGCHPPRVAPSAAGGYDLGRTRRTHCPACPRTRSVPPMASLDDVATVCLALPETSEVLSRGARQWRVKDKLFVWERPLRRTDLDELGDA